MQAKGQNPLHQFPRSKSATSPISTYQNYPSFPEAPSCAAATIILACCPHFSYTVSFSNPALCYSIAISGGPPITYSIPVRSISVKLVRVQIAEKYNTNIMSWSCCIIETAIPIVVCAATNRLNYIWKGTCIKSKQQSFHLICWYHSNDIQTTIYDSTASYSRPILLCNR